MSYKLTIIVPIYNEVENLYRLEEELSSYLKNALVSTCVLFVDDGSNDGSLHEINAMCGNNEAFNFISFDKNYGLSTALKAGFDHVSTELIGYIDADLQTTPNDFNLLLKYIHNYEMVTGIRIDRNDSFIKKMSSKIANRIRRLFTRDGIQDTGCPLKVIKTEYAKRIPMFRGLHRFLPAMIHLQNCSIKQVPVKHYPRLAGKNKFGLWNRLFSPLIDCFAFLWMKRRYINYRVPAKRLSS